MLRRDLAEVRRLVERLRSQVDAMIKRLAGDVGPHQARRLRSFHGDLRQPAFLVVPVIDAVIDAELLAVLLLQVAAEFLQTLAKLGAGLLYRDAVEIGAGGSSGGDGGADGGCAGFRYLNQVEGNVERLGADLRHLGVDALADLHAPVHEGQRAIPVIDVDDGAALIEHAARVGDTVLQRDHADAALAPEVVGIELADLALAPVEVGLLHHELPQAADVAVLERLAVGGDVEFLGRAAAVQVFLAHGFGQHAERVRHLLDGRFAHHADLRDAEGAHRRVAGLVGAIGIDLGEVGRDHVRSVAVGLHFVEDEKRAVVGAAAIGVVESLVAFQLALRGEHDVIVAVDGMALAHDFRIGLAAQDYADGSIVLVGGERGRHREEAHARGLAAEAAADEADLNAHLAHGNSQHLRDYELQRVEILRGRVYRHAAGVGDGERGLRLHVEVHLLAGALPPVRDAHSGPRLIWMLQPFLIAAGAFHLVEVSEERRGGRLLLENALVVGKGQRFLFGEDRRLRIVDDAVLLNVDGRGRAFQFGFGENQPQRLAGVDDVAGSEDRKSTRL